jgi:hypothetical protein
MILVPGKNNKNFVDLVKIANGRLGCLFGPNSKNPINKLIPFAVDNGAFYGFNEDLFIKLLDGIKKSGTTPMWVLVPDKVADANETFNLWDTWHRRKHLNGFKLAFAAQDGMTPKDIPRQCVCCFIGGTKTWKLVNAHRFVKVRELTHIGRIWSLPLLKWAERVGADSVDSSAFFRIKEVRFYMYKYLFGNPLYEKTDKAPFFKLYFAYGGVKIYI